MITPDDKPMSEREFLRLPRAQRGALLREADAVERSAATARRNASTAAQAARARYAASSKGKAARAAAYRRDKARRLAATPTALPVDPLFGV